MKWTEIADRPRHIRMETLSKVLSQAGIENDFTPLEANEANFESVLKKAMSEFDQIRIGGNLCSKVLALTDNTTLPARQIGAADALVKMDGRWWPRNFLVEGLQHALVTDIPALDIGASAFIVGANWSAAAGVAALSRIGFRKFTVTSAEMSEGEAFVEKLRRSFFDTQIQFVNRSAITQLPSVHSFALNTLDQHDDQSLFDELIYFNYLKLGGVWLNLPLRPTKGEELASIDIEAGAAGAFIEEPVQIAVDVDRDWAEACIHKPGFSFNSNAYRFLLALAMKG